MAGQVQAGSSAHLAHLSGPLSARWLAALGHGALEASGGLLGADQVLFGRCLAPFSPPCDLTRPLLRVKTRLMKLTFLRPPFPQ